ncbi:5-oxoprolinase subunit PxpA [Aliikangiella sp. IMCC44359]|uniref:5-oxoprolinase subunit PxpA n=1 Tax=Aliikangiella sp. IMCC44359 TaxID=3459125 RepID=UPI00403AD135
MSTQNISFIDINCDLGEGSTIAHCQGDAAIMPYISRCNIACGGHAGNVHTMKQSLINAQKYQLFCGAHPSYPDQINFGRKSLTIHFEKLADSIRQQIDTLVEIAEKQTIGLSHIKLHGALYNDAEKDIDLAEKLVTLLSQYYPSMSLLGLANGQLQQIAQQQNINFLREGFMDRAYQTNGQLVPRTQSNAVHTDSETIIKQALNIAQNKPIKSIQGTDLKIAVDTICLHGDGKNASQIASDLLKQLKEHRISIQ